MCKIVKATRFLNVNLMQITLSQKILSKIFNKYYLVAIKKVKQVAILAAIAVKFCALSGNSFDN